MNKPRRSRYEPAASGAPRSARSRHLEVLEALLRYRYLGEADVGEILGVSSAHRRMLTELFHSGLVARRHVWGEETQRQRGSPASVYVLTPKGLRHWAEQQGGSVDLSDPSFAPIAKRVASRARPKVQESEFTEHAWAVSRCQRALERSAETAGLTVETFIADREHGAPEFRIPVPDIVQNPDAEARERKPYAVRGQDRPFTVQPDATYVLRNPRISVPDDWPDDRPRPDERCYVLELDNARRKMTRYLRRALGYLRLVTTEAGQEAIVRDLGYHTVDLVFVSPTRARRDQLRALTLATPGVRREVLGNAIFWFVALEDILEERGSGGAKKRPITVAGDRLFEMKDPIAVKLDGSPSPMAMPGFLLGRGGSR